QARGTPSTSAIAVAVSEQRSDRRRAWSVSGAASSRAASGQGARTARPARGRRRSSTAPSAASPIGAGVRRTGVLRDSEATAGEHAAGFGAEDEVREGPAAAGVGALLEDGQRVAGDHVLGVRDVDARDLSGGGPDVRHVDDPGIRLAEGDLGDHRLDVLLLAPGGDLDPRHLEGLVAVPAAGHRRRAEDHSESGPGQVGQAPDSLRVARLDRDLEPVAGKDAGLPVDVIQNAVHVVLVGGGEDVGRSSLRDLAGQLSAAGEAELDPDSRVPGFERPSDLLEGIAERCRGEHRDGTGRRAGRGRGGRRRRAPGEQEGTGGGRNALHRGSSTTTLVAFTAAIARTPGSRPSSSAASRDIRETTRWGPDWISTWAITPSFKTRVTTPGKRLRADWATIGSGSLGGACSARNRASASPSTRRCPPSVRTVGSRPPSIQRRTVSALTPASSATCPMR